MVLNGLQKAFSFHHYFTVFNRYHLVEINGLSLIDIVLWLLIAKPHLTRPKWFQMVPCAELIAENLQLVLDLSVIATRSWNIVPWHWVFSLNIILK